MQSLYVSADGDDIGSSIEYFILTNDLEALGEYFESFRQAFADWTERFRVQTGAQIISDCSNNFISLIDIDETSLRKIQDLQASFHVSGRWTVSVGIGNSPRAACIALRLAKASGKNCVRHFNDFDTHVAAK